MRGILYVLVAVSACAAAELAFAEDNATNAAIDQAFGDHAQYEAMILSFQKAVAARDAAAVAELVSYPINVSIKGRKTTVSNAKESPDTASGFRRSGISTKRNVSQDRTAATMRAAQTSVRFGLPFRMVER